MRSQGKKKKTMWPENDQINVTSSGQQDNLASRPLVSSSLVLKCHSFISNQHVPRK